MGVIKLNQKSSTAKKQLKEVASTYDAVPVVGNGSEAPRGEGEITNLTVWSSNDHIDIMDKAIEVQGGDGYEFEVIEKSYVELENQLKLASGSDVNIPDITIYRDEKIYDIVKSYQFAETDLSNLSSDFFDHKINLVSSANGSNVIGVPCTSDIVGLYYNITILQQCGIDLDDFENLTWDQVIAIAETIKSNFPNIYVFPPLTSEIQILIRSLDVNCFSESEKLINSDAAQQIFHLLKELRDNDFIPLAEAGKDHNEELDEYIRDNKCAFIMGGPWVYSLILENAEDSRWGVTRIPTSDTFANQVSLGGSSWLVTQNGSEEQAFDFLTQTFGVSDEVALSIAEKNLVPAWSCYCLSEVEYNDNIFDNNVIEFLNSIGNEVESFDFSEYIENLNENLFNNNTMSFFDICESLMLGSISLNTALGYYGAAFPYNPPIPNPPTPPTTPKLMSIEITKMPDKILYSEGEVFDKTGMEVTAYYDDGTHKLLTGYQFAPTRALTIDDGIITVTYNSINAKLPIKVAIQNGVDADIFTRSFVDGFWSDWEHYDYCDAYVEGSADSQVRAVISINKRNLNLGKRKSAGVELWLKISKNDSSAKGSIKINNTKAPLNQGYAHAYIGKMKLGDKDNFEINLDFCDVNVEFEDAYVVFCRDKDPATRNTSKQIPLTAGATADADILLGKLQICFTDFEADSTLLGLNIQHIYGQGDEDYGCGKHFRLNLYERLETDAFTENKLEKSHCYTDGSGNKHSFNVAFYIEVIDIDNSGAGLEVEDTYCITKKYLTDLSHVDYYESSGQYIFNSWIVMCEQTTVNNQFYLSKPTQATQSILDSLSFDEVSEPVCWLRGDSTTKGFNKAGNLVMISDEFGNYIQIFYGSNGLISSVKDNRNNVLEFSYNGKRLSYIKNMASKKKVKYTYDQADNLSSISYCTVENNGAETVYKKLEIGYTKIYNDCKIYDVINYIESTDKLLSELVYEDECSADTRLIGIKNYTTMSGVPTGSTVRTQTDSLAIAYDDNNSVITLTDDYDNKEIYKFSDDEVLTEYYEVTNGLVSKAEKNEYTAYGSNVTVSAIEESLNIYSYASFNFIDGTKSESTLTPFNKPSRTIIGKIYTGNNTFKTQDIKYLYDNRNRCIKEDCTERFYNAEYICVNIDYYTVSLFYDDTTDALVKKVVHIAHDENGRRIEEFANAEEYIYDAYGNVKTTKRYRLNNPHSVSGDCTCDSSATTDIFYTEQSFDNQHRVLTVKDSRGLRRTHYDYVSGTNLVNKITYPDNGSEVFAYNSENQVTEMSCTVNGVENKNTTQYTCSEVTKLNHSGNNAIEYVYDSKRRISSIKLNNKLYESYAYNEKVSEGGNLVDKVTVTNANNEKFTAVADRQGSFDKSYYNDTLILQNTYNARGELTKTDDKLSNIVTTCMYNRVGALTDYMSTKSGSTYKESIKYDVKGRLKMITYSGLVSRTDMYTYSETAIDKVEKLTTGNFEIIPAQDLFERYIGKIVKVGAKTMLERITYLKEDDHLTNLPNAIRFNNCFISYSYDVNGNISSITQDGSLVAKYSYDKLNRLVREDNQSLGKSYFYTYDNNGNITSREECNFTTGSHTLGTGTVINYSYDKNQMLYYNGQECEYDAVGNPTTYRGNEATWERGRKLTAYLGNSFEYDGQGRRIKKNNITFTYDSQGRLLKQSNGLEFFYDTKGLLGVRYNNADYVYSKDIQGNIIAILDSNGNVVVYYEYDAWGNHAVLDANGNNISSGIGALNPFRYRSYYYDTETDLYFLQSRYYDPEVGRFLNIDSIEYVDPETLNGLNLYAYCNDNPVMGYDPEGTWNWSKFWKTLAVVAIAVVVVAAVAAVTVATGGTAAPVLVGAGIGAATSFGSSIVTQIATTGTVDVGQLFVDTAVGGVMGAFGGSSLGVLGMTVAGGLTGFAGSVANDIVAGEDINWGNAIASGAAGAFFGLISGGGAQHGKNATLKTKLAERKTKAAKGRPLRSITDQIKNERKLLTKAAIKDQLSLSQLGCTSVLDYVVYGTLSAYQHRGR